MFLAPAMHMSSLFQTMPEIVFKESSIPSPLQTTTCIISSLLYGVSQVHRLLRRSASPFLFTLGLCAEQLSNHSRFLHVAAHIISITQKLLVVQNSVTRLTNSYTHVKSIKLFPSTAAILYIQMGKQRISHKKNLSYTRLMMIIPQEIAKRMVRSLTYIKNCLLRLLILSFHVYELAKTLLFSESESRESTCDLFLNIQECGKLLSENRESLLHLFQTLHLEESWIAALLNHFSSLYQHFPSNRTLESHARKGGSLLLQATIGL